MTISSLILIVLMTLTGAFGGYFFKLATSSPMGLHSKFLINMFFGGGLYCLSAVLNIIVLKHMAYTIVYPLTSITYVWTMFITALLLAEKITLRKIFGVCFIFIGAFILVM